MVVFVMLLLLPLLQRKENAGSAGFIAKSWMGIVKKQSPGSMVAAQCTPKFFGNWVMQTSCQWKATSRFTAGWSLVKRWSLPT